MRLLLACARLHWRDPLTPQGGLGEPLQQGEQLLACLRRALTAADAALPPSLVPGLLLKVGGAYVDFLEAGVPTVSRAGGSHRRARTLNKKTLLDRSHVHPSHDSYPLFSDTAVPIHAHTLCSPSIPPLPACR